MPPWKLSRDPLFRGDSSTGVQVPDPVADKSIVRHVLYLDGPGRLTPYVSTSESMSAAQHFAGRTGVVWSTTHSKACQQGVAHRPRKELLELLRGKGKGDAAWHSAFEVAQARRYVEEWDEHLFDFRDVPEPDRVVAHIFEPADGGRR